MKLATPITAHGETLSEITLKRPTAAQAREIGALPYRVGEDGVPQPLVAPACRYIAVCAGIPPSSVDQLDITDLNALACFVTFFLIACVALTAFMAFMAFIAFIVFMLTIAKQASNDEETQRKRGN